MNVKEPYGLFFMSKTLLLPSIALSCSMAAISCIAGTVDNSTPADSDSINWAFNEIIVDAARIPQNISKLPMAIDTLDHQEITRAQAQLGLDESLVNIPGLVLQNRFNFAQDLRISIRGFGARSSFGIRGVKIIVDGIPETLADGQGGIDSIDLASIGKIEVIRGPASSLYGNASGGVINISSDFDNPDSGAEVRFAFGGDGYEKNQLSINQKTDKLSYIVSASELEIDGYREHSEHENRLFNSRVRYIFDDESVINLSLNYTDQPFANDPGGVTLETIAENRRAARETNVSRNAGEALNQTRIGLQYKKPIGDNGELTLRNYHVWREFDGLIPLASNGAIDLNRYYAGGGVMYQHKLDLNGNDNRTIVGIDYDRQDDDRKRFQNLNGIRGSKVLDQRELASNVAIYVQNHLSLGESWLITAGVRYDEVRFDVDDKQAGNSGKRTLNQLSPMMGASFSLNKQTTLYGTVSTAFETPTTTELALPDTTGLNTNLNAQEATNYELGVKGNIDQTYQYTLAIFRINVDEEIITLEDNLGRDLFVNAGESSREGLELSIAAQISDQLTVSLAYTWSDFEFETFIDANGNNFANNELPGLPQNQVHLEFSYQNLNGIFATLETLYIDEFALNNANSVYSESSTVSDFRAGYLQKVEQWSLEPFVGISNVFNESYLSNARINAFGSRYYEVGPDRNVYAGISIRHSF